MLLLFIEKHTHFFYVMLNLMIFSENVIKHEGTGLNILVFEVIIFGTGVVSDLHTIVIYRNLHLD